MKSSKSGSAIVEATLIIPCIVAVIITVIYIIIGLYHLVEQNSELHRILLMRWEEDFSVGDFIRKIDLMKGLLI